MFSFFKKKKEVCNHYWHKLSDEQEWYYGSDVYDLQLQDVTYIMCEKCETEVKISPEKWKRIDKKQEIIEYKYKLDCY